MQSAALSMSDTLSDIVDHLEIALPPLERMEQDEEWVVVKTPSGWRKIRLHDYHEVFKVPGLYEKWVYQTLQCQSPQKMADMMARALLREGVDAGEINLLDLGAGNGCVADELQSIGLARFVGLDIIPEARAAAERDRPGLYADYLICDMTRPSATDQTRLAAHGFTAMACVAALGFGDIPPAAFTNSFNAVLDDGWIAFNIKSDFLDDPKGSPFAMLIHRMLNESVLEVIGEENYIHRLSPLGEALEYTAIVGRKQCNIPNDWFDSDEA